MTCFDCADCGVHVVSFVYYLEDEPMICLNCRFLRSIPDPVEREAVRKFLARHDEEQGNSGG